MMRMWGGRFAKEPEEDLLRFSSSLDFDMRLYPFDVACSRAWSRALARAGVIDEAELTSIEMALDEVYSELKSGAFEFRDTDEDIHTAVERRVIELAGTAAGKMRTGRSRNDQVATDTRLLVMEECVKLISEVRMLERALLDQAVRNSDVVIPGHTHLQKAQPVLLSHLLLAFLEMFARDEERLRMAREAADVMPLGSGALAGADVPVDREYLASQLGFTRISSNSVDAVSDRDFACDLVYALSMTVVHLSRLAEQLVLWCSEEFGLAELDDAWATGSSLMPQKKNPDGPELVRGKSGRVVGDLVTLLTMLKGLPLAYNRDMQEDKEALFDALDTVSGCLSVMEGTVSTMSFNREAALMLTREGFITATDLAGFLTGKGMDFPRAHEVAGRVVSYCLETGRGLSELSEDELTGFSPGFEGATGEAFGVEASLKRRDVPGGTSPDQVSARIHEARERLSGA